MLQNCRSLTVFYFTLIRLALYSESFDYSIELKLFVRATGYELHFLEVDKYKV